MKDILKNWRRLLPLACVAAAALALLLTAALTLPRVGQVDPVTPTEALLSDAPSEAPTAPSATEDPDLTMIKGVPVLLQQGLEAGCETYACTMLLQYLRCDIDEYGFADQYLFCKPISYDDSGERYGPDMRSAFAGTAYEGYGIYAPAMAKSMNNYFKDAGKSYVAHAFSDTTLDMLCKVFIDRGIPVMTWITTNMSEPVDKASWIVNYVDDNATTKVGDTYTWQKGEHCVVLIGYDKENYYFADSVAGDVSVFDKALSEQRFAQMGSQGIYVSQK